MELPVSGPVNTWNDIVRETLLVVMIVMVKTMVTMKLGKLGKLVKLSWCFLWCLMVWLALGWLSLVLLMRG